MSIKNILTVHLGLGLCKINILINMYEWIDIFISGQTGCGKVNGKCNTSLGPYNLKRFYFRLADST